MKSTAKTVDSFDPRTEAIEFCRNTNEYFDDSEYKMQEMDRRKIHELQEEGLKYRFETLVEQIPMLDKLAGKQGIKQVESIEDVVPLLFEHTMYKSYPPSLLYNNRFTEINKFLSRLTTFDLQNVDVSYCRSIDDWFAVMDSETELMMTHSSGTSGVMSFNPISKHELNGYIARSSAALKDRSDGNNDDWHIVQPYYANGGGGALRPVELFVDHLCKGDRSRLVAAYPGRMSSDVLYLAARIRSAKAKGELNRLEVDPELLERLREYEALQKDMPKHLNKFFKTIANDLHGKKIYAGGTWNLLHNFAREGLADGQQSVFSPGSVILTSGGTKGNPPPSSWQEDVCRFIGVDRLHTSYSMSEVHAQHHMCEWGHYHLSPAAITFVLDPETSKLLPRQGRVTGRAAFFDLTAETRWGGFITGDEITVNWEDHCPCGRKSAFIEGSIQRYSDKNGGDDKISCVATESAYNEAMDFLTNF